MLPVILISIVLVLAGFFLFSVRLLFVKNGEFKGTCANNNPFMQSEAAACAADSQARLVVKIACHHSSVTQLNELVR